MAKQRMKFFLQTLIFIIVTVAAATARRTHSSSNNTPSYYEVLELDENANLKDIKSAYRRLALEHHPDRNHGREEEAAIKFREIGEAYEVLSDPQKRSEYDTSRKYNSGESSDGGDSSYSFHFNPSGKTHRDPFAQFNDVFENDPFFADVFENDPFFADAFQNLGDTFPSSFGRADSSFSGSSSSYSSSSSSTQRRSGSSYSYSSSSNTRGGGDDPSYSYTSSSTSTVYQNGHEVTKKTMQKDGNKIEETYVDGKLTDRKVNGKKITAGWISGF